MDDAQIEKYKRMKFLSEGGRRIFFLYLHLIGETYTLKKSPIPIQISIATHFQSHTTRWYFLVNSKNIFDDILEKHLNNPELFSAIESNIVSKKDILENFILQNDFSRKDKEGLVESMYTFQTLFEDLMFNAAHLRWIDRGIMQYFERIFAEKSHGIISRLAVSTKHTKTREEEVHMLNLATYMREQGWHREDRRVLDFLGTIHDEFRYNSCGYFRETPKTFDEYREELAKLSMSYPVFRNNEFERNQKREIEKRDETRLSIQDVVDKRVFPIIAEIPRLKDLFKYAVNFSIAHARNLWEEIAMRSGVDVEVILDSTPHEIARRILEGYENISERTARADGCVSLGTTDGMTMLIGKEAKEFQEEFLMEQSTNKDRDQQIFSGRPACPGRVQGRVRIILSSDEFHKMRKGAIIVALNTSPDYVPIMKRAGAILTEEGGITSHASVVSRELGVPCIVGISHVTEKLRDGDLVEADAERGVVKIVRRAGNAKKAKL